ncbi:hypothetical protein BDQ17DRAFT_1241030, partial [Cyathus striatus]
HASAHNVIEYIFGVVKKHWDILTHPSQFNMTIQACIPPALAAAHNFITILDPFDNEEILNELDDIGSHGDPSAGTTRLNQFGSLANDHPSAQEKQQAKNRWDQISQAMWDSYMTLMEERGTN